MPAKLGGTIYSAMITHPSPAYTHWQGQMSLSVRTEVCEPNADAASKTVCKTIISVSVHAAQWLMFIYL